MGLTGRFLLRRCGRREKNRKPIDNSGGSGIINTGAISGALNPYSKEAEKHAIQYYEAVRHMKTDTKRISASINSRLLFSSLKNRTFCLTPPTMLFKNSNTSFSFLEVDLNAQ